ncbi:hypothetical protein [Caudoviricetes sp.]|nr:hypothetical protein [Caudoviricetes sp.]
MPSTWKASVTLAPSFCSSASARQRMASCVLGSSSCASAGITFLRCGGIDLSSPAARIASRSAV